MGTMSAVVRLRFTACTAFTHGAGDNVMQHSVHHEITHKFTVSKRMQAEGAAQAAVL
jgi:hypothetical protein